MKAFLILCTLLFNSSFASADQCSQVYERAPSFVLWNFNHNPKSLRAEQFLPADYIKELETHFRKPVKVRISQKGSHPYRDLLIYIDGNPSPVEIVMFTIYQKKQNPEAALIEHLTLENPLATPSNLRGSQQKKGLPTSVARYLSKQVNSFLLAGGFKILEGGTAQDILVYQLYRRLVGLNPSNEQAQQFSNLLDYYMKVARKDLPEPFRVQSLNQLIKYFNRQVPSEVTAAWKSFLSGKAAPITIFADSNGVVFGFTYNNNTNNNSSFYFIDLDSPNQRIFTWENVKATRPAAFDLAKSLIH